MHTKQGQWLAWFYGMGTFLLALGNMRKGIPPSTLAISDFYLQSLVCVLITLGVTEGNGHIEISKP